MQIFLVGGAVRDRLLGLPIHERDWVVVGSSVEEMLSLGYQPVGKDFPVFLHPETKEEYALARTEKKSGKGYHGFTFHADPNVTLEEDLKRRDLTINAMAEGEQGNIIDPYNGQADLKKRCLHHVSEAFAEDPVRILRLARFATKLPDFNTHPDTVVLMQKMVANGEVDALVAERVWKECERALQNKAPARFFEKLQEANALERLLPCGEHFARNQKSLKKACELSSKATVRWASWNASLNSEDYKQRSKRYRLPAAFKELGLLLIEYHSQYEQLATHPDAEQLLHVLTKMGALRSLEKLTDFQHACAALSDNDLTVWNQRMSNIAVAVANADTQAFQAAGLQGQAFAQALKEKRLKTIEKMVKNGSH